MKKSLKKQAVFPVLMLLVVTALALIGSSFAWFSMANTATVTQVTGTIEKSSVGLMISKNAVDFTSNVTLDSGASTYVLPKAFHQVSTTNGINFFEATITKKNADGTAALIYTVADATTNETSGVMQGVVDKNATTKTWAASGTTSDASYMVFDLFFSVENNSTLYLDFGTAFNANADGKDLGTFENKAMRVAFIDKGSTNTGSSSDALALSASEGTVIWDPADETSYFGIKDASTSAKTFAPYASGSDSTTSGGTDDSSAHAQSVTTVATSALVPAAALTDESTLPTQAVATLAAGVNKIRVIVWLEGNDPTCTTSVAELAITLKLNFYARKTTV